MVGAYEGVEMKIVRVVIGREREIRCVGEKIEKQPKGRERVVVLGRLSGKDSSPLARLKFDLPHVPKETAFPSGIGEDQCVSNCESEGWEEKALPGPRV